MKKIIDQILKRQTALLSEIKNKQEKIDYLSNILKLQPEYETLFHQLEPQQLLIALILKSDLEVDLNTLIEKVNQLDESVSLEKNIRQVGDLEEIGNLNSEQFDNVKKYKELKNLFVTLKKMIKKDDSSIEERLGRVYFNSKFNFEQLLIIYDFFKTYPLSIKNNFEQYENCIKEAETEKNKVTYRSRRSSSSRRSNNSIVICVTPAKAKKVRNDKSNMTYMNKLSFFTPFFNYIDDLKKQVRFTKKELELLTKFINYLEKLDLKEYNIIPEEFINRVSLEFLIPAALKIFDNNNIMYKSLKSDNDKQINYEFEDLLKAYSFIPYLNEEEKSVLKKMGIPYLKEILDLFKNLPYKIEYTNERFMFLIKNTNPKNVLLIHRLIVLNLVSYSFVNNHIDIFLSPLNELLAKNLDILLEYNVKVKNIDELLFTKDLEIKLNLAQKYTLDLNDENCLKSINKPNFFKHLDSLIELNLFEYAKIDTTIFKQDLSIVIKKLYIMQQLKIPIFINNKFNSIVYSNYNFFVSEKELDNFIAWSATLSNINPNNMDILEGNNSYICLETSQLDDYFMEDELTYNFDGIIISRIKVLRNLALLENSKDLLDCIIYGSILPQQSIDQIKNCLLNIGKNVKREIESKN